MAESNRDCYTFQQMDFKEGFLQKSVDATYILTMENSPRMKSVMEQLKEFQPTKRVYIVVNKGFKACKKDLPKQNSIYDIIHANLQVFHHASAHSYENILILEDDFIFDAKIQDGEVQNVLNTFMMEHKHTSFIYTLGCLPALVIPYDFHTYHAIWSLTTHAVVYSKQMREEILNYSSKEQMNDWDLDISTLSSKSWNKYMYRTSLCHQTFPNTDNRQNWNIVGPFRFLSNTFIDITNFDKQPEPGTSILYGLAFILSTLVFSLAIFLVYYSIRVIFSFMQPSKVLAKRARRG